MKNYYFTFGFKHVTTDGIPLFNNWVRVRAKDYGRARELFVNEFTSKRMETIQSWAFQYEEQDFQKDLFAGGEYFLIEE